MRGRASVVCASFAMMGCALSPGIGFDEALVAEARRAPADAAASMGVAGRADMPPAGALQSITPELIRAQRAVQARDVGEGVRRLFGVSTQYRIGPGDILNIVVWDHPALALAPAGSITTDATSGSPVSNGYNVSQDGLIQFPYVGSFRVGGLTEYEVRDGLAARLAKYLAEPKLTVRIQSFRSGRVYVDGSVRAPGPQAVNDIPMTLPEAISRAGGFAADADRSSVAVSREGRTTVVNMSQLTALGVNPNKIMLRAGDMVRVFSQDDSKVYVLGEVTRPSAQVLRNGRLSLNQALGEAGGVSAATGNPRQIFVVRAKVDGAPEVYHLDASTPVSYALAEGFELQARDVVYVDPVPLVRWSRVVNLVLPSAQVVGVGNNIAVK
jgi:polysaccharide export outer membrane protein